MKRILKWLLSLLALAILLAGAFFIHVWYFKPASINWFYGRVFAQFAAQSPELLSNMRILPPWLDIYSDKLDGASPAHEAEVAAMVKSDVDTLHRYDRAKLDANGALSYDVLDYFLSIQVEGDAFRDHDFPVNQLSGIQSSLPNGNGRSSGFVIAAAVVSFGRAAASIAARRSRRSVSWYSAMIASREMAPLFSSRSARPSSGSRSSLRSICSSGM